MAEAGEAGVYVGHADTQVSPLYVHFPFFIRQIPGIQGHVTLNGASAADVSLELRFFNGSSWSTLATILTDSNGDYLFPDAPGLGPGQSYYVRYRNSGTPGRLWVWSTPVLTSYPAGSRVKIGDFADIVLVAPDNRT